MEREQVAWVVIVVALLAGLTLVIGEGMVVLPIGGNAVGAGLMATTIIG
jgi:hypothetical protein